MSDKQLGMSKRKRYDVFISYSGTDQALVEELAGLLRQVELSVFLATQEIQPGARWQEEIQRALKESRACIVCIGVDGPGPWTREEINVAIDQSVQDRSFIVVPVFLPGAPPIAQASLPPFLLQRQIADLRRGEASLTKYPSSGF